MSKRPTSLQMIPETVPIFPLSGALLLPHTHRPLNVFEPRYVSLVDHVLGRDRLIGLIQPVGTNEESPMGKVPLKQVGCLGRLTHFDETEDNHYLIILHGVTRFEIVEEVLTDTPYRQCRISAERFAADFDRGHGEENVDRPRFLTMMRDYADFADLDLDWEEIEETSTADLVNLACMLSPYGAAEKQVLLEAKTLEARAETLIAMAELEMVRSETGAILQ